MSGSPSFYDYISDVEEFDDEDNVEMERWEQEQIRKAIGGQKVS
jgi:hypothetical protein